MGLKGEIMQLIRQRDAVGLERLIEADPRAVRHLLGRLWDADDEVRLLAAKGFGTAAVAHPQLTTDVVRRLIWALNDESAMNGVNGLAALGEIGFHNPGLIAPFVGPLASFVWDDGLRPGILNALARIVEAAPQTVEQVRDHLEPHLDSHDEFERKMIRRILGDPRGADEA
jgi:hypothetical protein